MSAYDDALAICSVLIALVVVPWGIITSPAFLQRFNGDGTALAAFEAQGFHWIAAFAIVFILLILLVGVWLD